MAEKCGSVFGDDLADCAGMTSDGWRPQFCPLFVESHNCRGLGCVDDMAAPCRVKRGVMDYKGGVAALAVADSKLVATVAFERDSFERAQQRQRNMRVNGIH